MAGTYFQTCYHLIFAPKFRAALLDQLWRRDLYAYIGALLKARGHMPLAIGGWDDHIHIFYSGGNGEGESVVVREIKSSTTKWINSHLLTRVRFLWQTGYASFTYTKSDRVAVQNYIRNQEAHHRKMTFRDEYKQILTRMGIPFDEKYLFDDPL